MSDKDFLVNGLDDMSVVMAEKVNKKQKIILRRWSWIMFVCILILLFMKVFG